MKRETMTKIFSTTLSLALVVSSAPVPAGAFGPMGPAAPTFVAAMTPPANIGYVASSYAPNGETKPRLIVIADLHGHVQVQRHIMGVLETLMGSLRKPGTASENKQVPIFVEGGWEPGLEEPLRTVQNPAVRSFMAEYFLQKAEINASQAYSEKVAGTGQVTLIGAETKEQYLANKARFVRTYAGRKALLLALQREEAALKVIENQVSGRTFKHLQEMRDDFYNGRVQPETYARALSRLARRQGITGKQVDVLNRARTASTTELEIALSEVYGSLIRSVASQKPLTSFLRESLQGEDNIRQNLARIDASLDLLKRLVGNQLTPAEVPLALARMPELVSVAQMLLDKSPMKDSAAAIVRESFDFYPFAMVRDDSLTDNSLKALDKMGTDATGILVAGGFHTDAIVDRLRSKHISYMLINPVVSRDLSATEQLNYVNRVCDVHVTPSELHKDIDAMRHGNATTLAGSAIGPVTDMESPKKPNDQSLFGGIANPVAASMHLAADAGALLNIMHKQGIILGAGSENLSPVNNVSIAEQLADVMGAAYAKIENSIQWAGSISLDRTLDGKYETKGSISPAGAQTLASVLNAVVAASEGGQANAQGINSIRMVAVPDDVAINELGAYGKIYWNADKNDGNRTIVLGQTQFNLVKHTLNQLDSVKSGSQEEAALQFALHNYVHEAVHAFDNHGQNEVTTSLKSVAITAGLIATHAAGETEARAAVTNFAAMIAGKLANSNEPSVRWIGVALPSLADEIASFFITEGFSAESVQKVVDLLAKNHPEQPRYNVEQIVTQEAKSARGRIALNMAAGQGDDKLPPEVAKKADEKLTEADNKAKGFLGSV